MRALYAGSGSICTGTLCAARGGLPWWCRRPCAPVLTLSELTTVLPSTRGCQKHFSVCCHGLGWCWTSVTFVQLYAGCTWFAPGQSSCCIRGCEIGYGCPLGRLQLSTGPFTMHSSFRSRQEQKLRGRPGRNIRC